MCAALSSQITARAQEPRIGPSASRSSSRAHKDSNTVPTQRRVLINSMQLLLSVYLVEHVNINISITPSTVNQASLLPPLPDSPTTTSVCSTWSTNTEITFSCQSHRLALQLLQLKVQQQWRAGVVQTSLVRLGLQKFWHSGYKP